MECYLTGTDLKVNKGMFVRVEKTIPLEKITDLGICKADGKDIARLFPEH